MTTDQLATNFGTFCVEFQDAVMKEGWDKCPDLMTAQSLATLFLARELASLRELLASTLTTDSSKNQAVRTTKVTR